MAGQHNRADRRKAAKGAGVKGQLVSHLAVVAEPVTAVTLAGTILAVLQRLERSGGAPLEHSTITVGDDHPEHVGKIVVEGKTDRMQRQAPRTPLKLGELASGGLAIDLTGRDRADLEAMVREERTHDI